MTGRSPLDILCDRYKKKFDGYLAQICSPRPKIPAMLTEAMAYSLLAGGKRLRPMLCLAAAEACGAAPDDALPMAAAVEFIHTASLIHDDLPCMDDDDLRRGMPTNHKVFGEAMAVIAGDSLMIWAFGFALSGLAGRGVAPERAAKAAAILADGSGPAGMCGGQVLDTDPKSRDGSPNYARRVASMKTAALIRAAVTSGAAVGGADDGAMACWGEYGSRLGLAFQIVDDILDVTSTREELGKTPHKDEEQGKITFVSSYGLDEARRMAAEESEAAAAALAPIFPDGDVLIDLAGQLASRTR